MLSTKILLVPVLRMWATFITAKLDPVFGVVCIHMFKYTYIHVCVCAHPPALRV